MYFVELKSLSPCGESGLKLGSQKQRLDALKSLPMRGEWIEILSSCTFFSIVIGSLPMRGEWIEILSA